MASKGKMARSTFGSGCNIQGHGAGAWPGIGNGFGRLIGRGTEADPQLSTFVNDMSIRYDEGPVGSPLGLGLSCGMAEQKRCRHEFHRASVAPLAQGGY